MNVRPIVEKSDLYSEQGSHKAEFLFLFSMHKMQKVTFPHKQNGKRSERQIDRVFISPLPSLTGKLSLLRTHACQCQITLLLRFLRG